MRWLKGVLFLISVFQLVIIHAQSSGEFENIEGSPVFSGLNPQYLAFSPLIHDHLYAAVPNSGDNTLSVYNVDLMTGVFTSVAAPYSTDTTPTSIAFSPIVNDLLFAALTCSNSNTVLVYQVNATTGVFTPVIGSMLGTLNQPNFIAFSPVVSGLLFAAVTNAGNETVSIYSVDTTTGVFNSIGTSPTGNHPNAVAYSLLVKGNLFAAIANENDNNVSVYKVDTLTGEFNLVELAATGETPTSLAFSPPFNDHLFAAVTNYTSSTVSVYSVDETSGAFTPVSFIPYSTGIGPQCVAYSPLVNGNLFAAVADHESNSVSVYSVDGTTGAFISLRDSPFVAGSQPFSVAFSPLVRGNIFAAVANYNANNVSVYSVALPPTVAGVSPSQGPDKGGTTVSIFGTKLMGATGVLFGSTPAASFVVVSDSQINAVSPPGNGAVDVTVITSVGISAISVSDLFVYVSPPLPPTHVKGCEEIKRCKKAKNVLITLIWDPPLDSPLIADYLIYKNETLTKLAGKVSSAKPLKFKECRDCLSVYSYYIVSVNIYGEVSKPVKVKVTRLCKQKKQDKSAGSSKASKK